VERADCSLGGRGVFGESARPQSGARYFPPGGDRSTNCREDQKESRRQAAMVGRAYNDKLRSRRRAKNRLDRVRGASKPSASRTARAATQSSRAGTGVSVYVICGLL